MTDQSLKNKTHHISGLQQWLENIWYHGGWGRFLLLPLSALYCGVNRLQYLIQTNKQTVLPCPVIIVGNISVGGTGKTPLTVHIIKLLQSAGYKPAIVTRGYGGESTVWPQSVTGSSDPKLVGDEAVLMAARTNVPVYAGANRLESISTLLKQHDCDVVVSDDGMQHYKLPRDIEVAVIDASRMLGNGYCLPAGPLREPKKKLESCDFIIINGSKEVTSSRGFNSSFNMTFEGGTLINLKTGEEIDLTRFKHKNVIAVTGIGNPKRFYQTLEKQGLKLEMHSFPDHHSFTQSDFSFNSELSIIMTEKDAVKCKSFAHTQMWYLPISARLDQSFDKNLLSKLKVTVEKSKIKRI